MTHNTTWTPEQHALAAEQLAAEARTLRLRAFGTSGTDSVRLGQYADLYQGVARAHEAASGGNVERAGRLAAAQQGRLAQYSEVPEGVSQGLDGLRPYYDPAQARASDGKWTALRGGSAAAHGHLQDSAGHATNLQAHHTAKAAEALAAKNKSEATRHTATAKAAQIQALANKVAAGHGSAGDKDALKDHLADHAKLVTAIRIQAHHAKTAGNTAEAEARQKVFEHHNAVHKALKAAIKGETGVHAVHHHDAELSTSPSAADKEAGARAFGQPATPAAAAPAAAAPAPAPAPAAAPAPQLGRSLFGDPVIEPEHNDGFMTPRPAQLATTRRARALVSAAAQHGLHTAAEGFNRDNPIAQAAKTAALTYEAIGNASTERLLHGNNAESDKILGKALRDSALRHDSLSNISGPAADAIRPLVQQAHHELEAGRHDVLGNRATDPAEIAAHRNLATIHRALAGGDPQRAAEFLNNTKGSFPTGNDAVNAGVGRVEAALEHHGVAVSDPAADRKAVADKAAGHLGEMLKGGDRAVRMMEAQGEANSLGHAPTRDLVDKMAALGGSLDHIRRGASYKEVHAEAQAHAQALINHPDVPAALKNELKKHASINGSLAAAHADWEGTGGAHLERAGEKIRGNRDLYGAYGSALEQNENRLKSTHNLTIEAAHNHFDDPAPAKLATGMDAQNIVRRAQLAGVHDGHKGFNMGSDLGMIAHNAAHVQQLLHEHGEAQMLGDTATARAKLSTALGTSRLSHDTLGNVSGSAADNLRPGVQGAYHALEAARQNALAASETNPATQAAHRTLAFAHRALGGGGDAAQVADIVKADPTLAAGATSGPLASGLSKIKSALKDKGHDMDAQAAPAPAAPAPAAAAPAPAAAAPAPRRGRRAAPGAAPAAAAAPAPAGSATTPDQTRETANEAIRSMIVGPGGGNYTSVAHHGSAALRAAKTGNHTLAAEHLSAMSRGTHQLGASLGTDLQTRASAAVGAVADHLNTVRPASKAGTAAGGRTNAQWAALHASKAPQMGNVTRALDTHEQVEAGLKGVHEAIAGGAHVTAARFSGLARKLSTLHDTHPRKAELTKSLKAARDLNNEAPTYEANKADHIRYAAAHASGANQMSNPDAKDWHTQMKKAHEAASLGDYTAASHHLGTAESLTAGRATNDPVWTQERNHGASLKALGDTLTSASLKHVEPSEVARVRTASEGELRRGNLPHGYEAVHEGLARAAQALQNGDHEAAQRHLDSADIGYAESHSGGNTEGLYRNAAVLQSAIHQQREKALGGGVTRVYAEAPAPAQVYSQDAAPSSMLAADRATELRRRQHNTHSHAERQGLGHLQTGFEALAMGQYHLASEHADKARMYTQSMSQGDRRLLEELDQHADNPNLETYGGVQILRTGEGHLGTYAQAAEQPAQTFTADQLAAMPPAVRERAEQGKSVEGILEDGTDSGFHNVDWAAEDRASDALMNHLMN